MIISKKVNRKIVIVLLCIITTILFLLIPDNFKLAIASILTWILSFGILIICALISCFYIDRRGKIEESHNSYLKDLHYHLTLDVPPKNKDNLLDYFNEIPIDDIKIFLKQKYPKDYIGLESVHDEDIYDTKKDFTMYLVVSVIALLLSGYIAQYLWPF